MSLFIENCQAYISGKIVRTNLVLDDGIIVDITSDRVTCDDYLNVDGALVLPGPILSHIKHDGGEISDVSSACVAAGITTFLDVVELQGLESRRSGKNMANFGFHLSLNSDSIPDPKLLRNLASVFTEPNSLDAESEKQLFNSYKRISSKATAMRPAIDRIKETKNKLFLIGLNTKDQLALIKKYMKGKIFFDFDALVLIRDVEKPEDSLINYLEDGTISTLSFNSNALSTISSFLPYLLTAVSHKKMSMQKLVELFCENPASIFALNSKGYIEKGYDADLTVIDMNHSKEVEWHGIKQNLKGWPVMTIINGHLAFDNGVIKGSFGKEVKFDKEPEVVEDEPKDDNGRR